MLNPKGTHQGLMKFEELVNKINDLIENRVESNLKQVSFACTWSELLYKPCPVALQTLSLCA